MKTILASGVFDILHPGHIYYLAEAKKLGDRLAVIVTSDETARLQGKEPIFPEHHRLEIVSYLNMVDEAIIGRPGKQFEAILDVWPDVIAVGWDQCCRLKVQSPALLASIPASRLGGRRSGPAGRQKLKVGDEGILALKWELEKYNWQGQIVRIGKLPTYEVSSSIIKDDMLKLANSSKRKIQNRSL